MSHLSQAAAIAARVGARLRRRWKALALAGLGVVLLSSLAVALWIFDPPNYPARQSADLIRELDAVTDPTERAKLRKDIAQYQTDNQIKIWTTIVQAIGAAVLAIGGYFAWRNLRVAQQTLEATQAKLDVDREGQITNRFTQAVSQMGAELKNGKPNLEVRLGGIYALERLAKDSPKDHATIMEVLTAYVRQIAPRPAPLIRRTRQELRPARREKWRQRTSRAPSPTSVPSTAPVDEAWEDLAEPKPRADVEAILHILRRRVPREVESEDNIIDLHDAALAGAPLAGAHLDRAVLQEADLERAVLEAAHLTNANLVGARLVEASLQGARLDRAGLVFADLRGAYLDRADLTGALLLRADLRGAHLNGVDLTHAHLEGADLRETTGLTLAQVAKAREHGRGALLPEDWPPDWRARLGKEEDQNRATEEAVPALPPSESPSSAQPSTAPSTVTPGPPLPTALNRSDAKAPRSGGIPIPPDTSPSPPLA